MGLFSLFTRPALSWDVENFVSFSCIWRRQTSGTILASPTDGAYLVAHDEEVDWTIVREVLRYFRRNPQAADTIEGVARWRLLDERIETNFIRVSQAIEWLVSRGFLLREVTSPSTSIFRLNPREPKGAGRLLGVEAPGKREKQDVVKKKSRRKRR